eukprot:scaffold107156_cov17-Tisochrysis_lutea.AAC.1
MVAGVTVLAAACVAAGWLRRYIDDVWGGCWGNCMGIIAGEMLRNDCWGECAGSCGVAAVKLRVAAVLLQCGCGVAAVRLWCGSRVVVVLLRCGCGEATVWCGCSIAAVLLLTGVAEAAAAMSPIIDFETKLGGGGGGGGGGRRGFGPSADDDYLVSFSNLLNADMSTPKLQFAGLLSDPSP